MRQYYYWDGWMVNCICVPFDNETSLLTFCLTVLIYLLLSHWHNVQSFADVVLVYVLSTQIIAFEYNGRQLLQTIAEQKYVNIS